VAVRGSVFAFEVVERLYLGGSSRHVSTRCDWVAWPQCIAKTTISDQFEALQRLQATNVLDDMASRLSANPGGVKSGAYTVNSGAVYGTQTLQTAATCSSSVSLPALDLCEWNRALIGASVLQGGVGQAAPLNARGCIEVGPNSGSGEVVIRVAVAWQGLAPSAAPSITCGSGVYGDDRYRRVLFRDVAVR